MTISIRTTKDLKYMNGSWHPLVSRITSKHNPFIFQSIYSGLAYSRAVCIHTRCKPPLCIHFSCAMHTLHVNRHCSFLRLLRLNTAIIRAVKMKNSWTLCDSHRVSNHCLCIARTLRGNISRLHLFKTIRCKERQLLYHFERYIFHVQTQVFRKAKM